MPTDHGAKTLGFSIDARERLLSEAERIARMGSFAWHVESGVIHWSDELYRILGHEPGAVMPTSEAFFSAIHPEDLEKVQRVAQHGVETGIAESVEFRVVRADGSIRHVTMNGAALFDETGKPDRFVGTVLDLTERVLEERARARREEVLQQAQRVAHVGSFEWTHGGEETGWSAELYRICGITEGSKVEGGFLAFVHPDDREAYLDARRDAERGESRTFECRLRTSGGGQRHVRIQSKPLRDALESERGVLATVHDVTERKRLEAQLLQSQKMEALGRLAGGVAHDFNNILTVIGLHLERMRADEAREELGAMAKAVEHATGLTKQLLTFSRKSALTTRAVDLAALVDDARKMIDRVLGEHIRLLYEPRHGTWPVVGDPSQLTQVLVNLVLNARDAMPEGGAIEVDVENVVLDEVRPELTPQVRSGEYVVLSVRDDGIGMSESVQSHMFEPFFTTKEPGRGTGLGLSMVFGIVTQLAGALEVDTAPSRGTTISIYLPRAAHEHRSVV